MRRNEKFSILQMETRNSGEKNLFESLRNLQKTNCHNRCKFSFEEATQNYTHLKHLRPKIDELSLLLDAA